MCWPPSSAARPRGTATGPAPPARAVGGGAEDLTTALLGFKQANISVVDVGLRRPNLDDVFLTLTGHTAEDDVVAEEEK